MSGQELLAPVEINYQQRLGLMLKDLEYKGFHLYYDGKIDEWECMNKNSDIYIYGKDKYQVIQNTWQKIMGN